MASTWRVQTGYRKSAMGWHWAKSTGAQEGGSAPVGEPRATGAAMVFVAASAPAVPRGRSHGGPHQGAHSRGHSPGGTLLARRADLRPHFLLRGTVPGAHTTRGAWRGGAEHSRAAGWGEARHLMRHSSSEGRSACACPATMGGDACAQGPPPVLRLRPPLPLAAAVAARLFPGSVGAGWRSSG